MFQIELKFMALRRVSHLEGVFVLSSVEVTAMRLQSLSVNNQTVCEVDMDVPEWLPVRPRLNAVWLRSLVSEALRRYFSTNRVVVKA